MQVLSADLADFTEDNFSPATIVIAQKSIGISASLYTKGNNDHLIIQKAIDILAARGGGRILLKEGDYYGGVINLHGKNITIEGMGNSTVYHLANGVNPVNGIINIVGAQSYNWQLLRFKIDGNYTNNSSGDGIYINTLFDSSDSRQLIEDVEVINCAGSGFNLQQGGQTWLNRCRASYNRSYGFNLNASDGMFSNLIADTNQDNGIWANCPDGHYTNIKCYYNGQSNSFSGGIYVKAYNSYLLNVECQDNYYNGIVIDGSAHGCIINNCIGDSNGQSASSAGLVIYGNNNIVTGGMYIERDFPPAWTQAIGIAIHSTATGNLIFGAILYGNTTQYTDDSSGSNHHLGTNPAVLATGASHTVDDVITALQGLGLFKQS